MRLPKKPVKPRWQKPLVLSESAWAIIALLLRSFNAPFTTTVSRMIGTYGERAYRLGVSPGAKRRK